MRRVRDGVWRHAAVPNSLTAKQQYRTLLASLNESSKCSITESVHEFGSKGSSGTPGVRAKTYELESQLDGSNSLRAFEVYSHRSAKCKHCKCVVKVALVRKPRDGETENRGDDRAGTSSVGLC